MVRCVPQRVAPGSQAQFVAALRPVRYGAATGQFLKTASTVLYLISLLLWVGIRAGARPLSAIIAPFLPNVHEALDKPEKA